MDRYLKDLVSDILSGDVKASHVEYIKNIPILFTHAGIIPDFYNYLLSLKEISDKIENTSDNEKIDIIVKYINSFVIESVKSCTPLKCQFNDPLYDAAPCRGGDGIGGPL